MRSSRLSLALLALLPALAVAQDRIELLSGEPITGVKVLEETYRKVSYEKSGGSKGALSATRVADVIRSGGPEGLLRGRVALAGNDAEAAARFFEEALGSAEAQKWAKEYAAFGLGEAHLALGRGREAAQAFERVLEIHSESRLLPEARMGIARALAMAGDTSAATSSLEAFLDEIRDKRLPDLWLLRAKMDMGSILVGAERYADAAREYESLVRDAANLVSKTEEASEKLAIQKIALEAERRRGEALVRAGNLNDALLGFSGLPGKYSEVPGVKAVSAAGKARVALARGDADAARVELARVLTTELDADSAEPWILLSLAEAYAQLAEEGESGARDHARTYAEILVQRWPGTSEARLARDLQQKL